MRTSGDWNSKMTQKKDSHELSAKEIREREFYWAKEYGTREFGIGVQCQKCGKFRMAFEWTEERDVPEYFECKMIKIGGRKGCCSMPSELSENSEEFSEGRFVPGDIVLVRWPKYPMWPAIVTDDVNQPTNHFMFESGENLFYHVEFFDVARNKWGLVPDKSIEPYNGRDCHLNGKFPKKRKENYKHSMELAKKSLQVPKKIRIFWFLKYIKYREKKGEIDVKDIPIIRSISGEEYWSDVDEQSAEVEEDIPVNQSISEGEFSSDADEQSAEVEEDIPVNQSISEDILVNQSISEGECSSMAEVEAEVEEDGILDGILLPEVQEKINLELEFLPPEDKKRRIENEEYAEKYIRGNPEVCNSIGHSNFDRYPPDQDPLHTDAPSGSEGDF